MLLCLQFYTDNNDIVKRESSIRICKQQLTQGGNYGFKNLIIFILAEILHSPSLHIFANIFVSIHASLVYIHQMSGLNPGEKGRGRGLTRKGLKKKVARFGLD